MLIGLDVSTSIIGIALFNEVTGEFISRDYIDLRKDDDFYDKCERSLERFNLYDGSISDIFVEDRLGGFSMGKTTSQTLMKLAAFNATVSYVAFKKFGIRPVHIHPSTIKSIMKKEGLVIPVGTKGNEKKQFVLDWVVRREPSFKVELTRNLTPKPFMFDMADAYCIGLAGYKKFACDVKKS